MPKWPAFSIPNFQVTDFDLVEAGAGNGRLSADILRAARGRDPAFYESIQLHLVEASAEARAAQAATLGDVTGRLASSSAALPASFEGVLLANELLDALPVHQVVMRADGLREVYVDAAPGRDQTVAALKGPPYIWSKARRRRRRWRSISTGWG